MVTVTGMAILIITIITTILIMVIHITDMDIQVLVGVTLITVMVMAIQIMDMVIIAAITTTIIPTTQAEEVHHTVLTDQTMETTIPEVPEIILKTK